ncbi:MAG: SDR family oxidoreductase [Actinomycetota bacterium]|nr:SDR family oxidoreductase [Actinomycetota bacterium]
MRTALVGGGAGGIGSAVAAALLASGHRVVLVGRHTATLAEAASRIGPLGRVEHVVADLADPASSARAVEMVEGRHGAVDVAVVNAGGPVPGDVLSVTDEQWQASFELLLLGPMALVRRALPGMAERGFGRVVFVTSTAVRQPQPELATSTVLRSAVTAAAKLLSRAHADAGVTVNCVAPGATLTPRRQQILRSRAEAAGIDMVSAEAEDNAAIPAGRGADPAEVAAAVAFLASEAAGYVNGTVLTVDGGRTETI